VSLFEDLNAAKISGLTLYPSGGQWQCSTRSIDSPGWQVSYGTTPATALAAALKAPTAPKQKIEDLY